jgi:hypothetical protein
MSLARHKCYTRVPETKLGRNGHLNGRAKEASTTLASIVFSFTVLILQFASPFFCLAILRQLAPQAALRGAASLGSSIKGGLK